MRNALFSLAMVGLILSTTGCANGPFRQWNRGAACNTCNPPMCQPPECGTNIAVPCENGCNSGGGWFSNWFGRRPNTAPVSVPGDSFGYANGVSYYGGTNVTNSTISPMLNSPATIAPAEIVQPSAELYGSSVGNLVTPPAIGPFNGP